MQQEKKQDPYKEGDIVIWKINDHLILKAEVGERRKHIVTRTPRGEAEFYRPQYERYIGQFPIDYQPTRFAKISEVEAIDMPISKASRGYEFNLMLNGSTVQATDEIVESSYALDHPDQVKVVIKTADVEGDTKQFFDSYLMLELEADSAETNNGVTCYRFKDGSSGQGCFGHSLNDAVSGFQFYISPDVNYRIQTYTKEAIYGGLKVQWYVDQRNISRAQEIDAAIWRLLKIRNISPIE